MTIAVDLGRKATKQTNKTNIHDISKASKELLWSKGLIILSIRNRNLKTGDPKISYLCHLD